jgi:DNA-binding transcriptional LysR family regulator
MVRVRHAIRKPISDLGRFFYTYWNIFPESIMQSTERLKGVEVFVAVARAGSFTRAAERLNLTGSAVGKTIARLESRLGVRLFERSTRRLALTEAGTRFHAACSRVLGELEEAEHALADDNGGEGLAGRLRIDLPVTFGRLKVLPVLLPFLRRHPRLKPVLSFTDRYVDLAEEGIDLALRIGGVEAWPPSLGHRYLGQEQKIFCAAPAYLERHGAPATLDQLLGHAALMYGKADGAVSPWLIRHGDGRVEQRAPDAHIVSGNAEVQLELVLAGLGIAQLPTWLVDGHLADGSLATVLPAYSTPGLPLHLVWPKAREGLPKVSQLVAALGGALGAP